VRHKSLILLAALAVAAVMLAVPASRASARPAGPAVGIAEQHATMFASPDWKRLGLADTRYLTPWDTLHDPRQLALLDNWIAAARAAHARVLIGFGHSLRTQQLAHTLPTAAEMESEFRALRARYPWVRDWLAWNEANSPGGLTEHRPQRAAQYFDVLARNCPGCRIVAADVIDVGNMAGWVTRFRRAAHHTPRIWGLHNYTDANHLRSTTTRRFLKLTRGQVWLTETGGVVLRRTYRGTRVLHTYRYGVKHAAAATVQALRLGCLSRRIKRVYLYHWEAPTPVTSWDSAFVDGRGRTRPAYTALRRWLRAANASRRGAPRRTVCGR
jgi:Glycosyl hydrolase catalytic core